MKGKLTNITIWIKFSYTDKTLKSINISQADVAAV